MSQAWRVETAWHLHATDVRDALFRALDARNARFAHHCHGATEAI